MGIGFSPGMAATEMSSGLRKQLFADATVQVRVPCKRGSVGFTFIELIVFMVVVPIALTGVLVAVNAGIKDAPLPTTPLRRNELMHLYMEEAISSAYDEKSPLIASGSSCAQDLLQAVVANPCTAVSDLGPDGGEGRADYNDVDDYNGLKEGECDTGTTPLQDARGVTRVGYDGFCIEMFVAYDGDFNGQPNEGLTPPAPLILATQTELTAKRIRLRITDPDGKVNWVTAYRGGF